MSLRRRGMIRKILKWTGVILLGVMIGGGAGFGYHYYISGQIEKVAPVIRQQVITVNRNISLGEILLEEDLMVMQVEQENVPLGAFTLPEEAIGKKTWVNLVPKVVLQPNLFYRKDPEFQVNEQEVVVQKLPDNLEVGDYVDVRIQFPSGHDYCVLSHKQVGSFWQEKNMLTVGLSEDERVRLGSAQTDAETYEKAYLYLSIYPKAVDMPDTPVRYPVNGSVQALYEEVAGGSIVGNERNHLELALIQLKEEEKFLKTKETLAAEAASQSDGGRETQDTNLQPYKQNTEPDRQSEPAEGSGENIKPMEPAIKTEPTAQTNNY